MNDGRVVGLVLFCLFLTLGILEFLRWRDECLTRIHEICVRCRKPLWIGDTFTRITDADDPDHGQVTCLECQDKYEQIRRMGRWPVSDDSITLDN